MFKIVLGLILILAVSSYDGIMTLTSTPFTNGGTPITPTRAQFDETLRPHLAMFLDQVNVLNIQEQAVSTFFGIILAWLFDTDTVLQNDHTAISYGELLPGNFGQYDIGINSPVHAMMIELKNLNAVASYDDNNQLCSYLLGYKSKAPRTGKPTGLLTSLSWFYFYKCSSLDIISKKCTCSESNLEMPLLAGDWSNFDYDKLYDTVLPWIKGTYLMSISSPHESDIIQ